MIQFIFKVGNQQLELSSINDPALRTSFEDLKAKLASQVGSLTCKEHHRGPMVTLQGESSQAILAGFGGCCPELNVRVKDALLAQGYPTSEWVTMTSVKRYTM